MTSYPNSAFVDEEYFSDTSSEDSQKPSSDDSSKYSNNVDLSYNFQDVITVNVTPPVECIAFDLWDDDVAIARRKRGCCHYMYIWMLCHIEYYKRFYLGNHCRCCCGCCYVCLGKC